MSELIALILAGGKGERLKKSFSQGPKALAPIQDRPFLEIQLEILKKQGIKKFIILTGFGAEQIEKFCQQKNFSGIEISFSQEKSALGTAGALRNALENNPDIKEFLLINGDTYFDADLSPLWENSFNSFSMALTYLIQSEAVGKIKINKNYLIESFIEKPQTQNTFEDGYINAGVYYLNRTILDYISKSSYSSLENDVFPILVNEKKINGFPLPGKFLDIGTENNYMKAQEELPRRLCESKKPCMFLDRDGVLIKDKKYIGDPKLIEIISSAPDFLKWARKYWSKFIILTNQAGVARGHFSESDLDLVHKKLLSVYSSFGINFSGLYYCPDHPTHGRGKYLRNGPCRKPGSGMLLLASQDFAIDFKKSVMIGDKDSDVLMVPGLKTYLIQGDYPINENSSILFSDFKSLKKQLIIDFKYED